jgi:hypothetical protein
MSQGRLRNHLAAATALTLAALLIVLGGSSFADDRSGEGATDAAKRKACKRGQVPLTVRRDARASARRRAARRRCSKVRRIGASEADQTRAAMSALQDRALVRPGKRLRTLLARPSVRRQVTALQTDVTGSLTGLGARAAQRETQGGVTRPGAGEVGRGFEGEASGSEGGVNVTIRLKDKLFVEKCPQPNGDVPGEVEGLFALEVSGEVGGRRQSFAGALRWEGKLEGHVGDDAQIKDFGFDLTGSLEVRSSSQPTRVFRFTFSQQGLDPRALDPKGSEISRATGDVRGPRGSSLTSAEFEGVARGIAVAYMSTRGDAARRYLEAEDNWNRDARCLTADFSPAELRLKRGAQAPLDVSVKRTDGQPVSIALDATPLDGAQVTPARAETTPSPARFTLTAPDRKFDSAHVRFSGTSRQGRVERSFTILEEKAMRFRITVTGSLTHSSSFHFDYSPPTYVENGSSSASGTWKSVWRDVELRLDQTDVYVPQDCGGSPACATGTADYRQTYHLEQENAEGEIEEYDRSCQGGGSPTGTYGDAYFRLNRPEDPDEPVPLVPSARFQNFAPNLYWSAQCDDGDAETFELDSPFGWACLPDHEVPYTYVIGFTDFYVPVQKLENDDVIVVPIGNGDGASGGCLRAGTPPHSGSFSLRWSGTVTFERLDP